MIEARVDGRKRRGAMTREIARQKVILSIWMLSDDEGFCHLSNGEIARDCGLSTSAVRGALAEMERRGDLWVWDERMGFRRRSMAFPDHPGMRDPFDDQAEKSVV